MFCKLIINIFDFVRTIVLLVLGLDNAGKSAIVNYLYNSKYTVFGKDI